MISVGHFKLFVMLASYITLGSAMLTERIRYMKNTGRSYCKPGIVCLP